MKKLCFLLIAAPLAFNTLKAQKDDPGTTEVWTPVPPVVTPGTSPSAAPSDAVVLFDGKNLENWEGEKGGAPAWTLSGDNMTVKPGGGGIRTKQAFGSCQLHIEWRTPAIVKGEGQGRGNSGIFLMGQYELQVLDNYQNPTYSNGQAGSIYKQIMPQVNACRKPGEWQTYDIIFTAPSFFPDGRLKEAARITVLHNGVLIQNNVSLFGKTTYTGIARYELHADKLPLLLQDHGDLVSYRNIWVRPL